MKSAVKGGLCGFQGEKDLDLNLIILHLGRPNALSVSSFIFPSCMCVYLRIECLPSKSNPDNGNIKLIKYGPYIEGFKWLFCIVL